MGWTITRCWRLDIMHWPSRRARLQDGMGYTRVLWVQIWMCIAPASGSSRFQAVPRVSCIICVSNSPNAWLFFKRLHPMPQHLWPSLTLLNEWHTRNNLFKEARAPEWWAFQFGIEAEIVLGIQQLAGSYMIAWFRNVSDKWLMNRGIN